MNILSRFRSSYELFAGRRAVVGARAALAMRSVEKKVARTGVQQWPTIKFQHPAAKYPLFMRTGPSSDYIVAWQVFSRADYGRLRRLSGVRTLLDCGANAGYTSAYLLSAFPKARVVAIEPDPGNVELCRRNLAPYGERAHVLAGAVWSHPTTLSLVREPVGGDFAVRVVDDGAGGVQSWSPEQLIDLCGGTVDVLKIDIEHAEVELFRVGAPWMRSVRNVAIELHNAECANVFHKAMSTYECQTTIEGEITYCFDIKHKAEYGTFGASF